MKIVVLGSGNVATHLATALHDAGHEVAAIWSRTAEHAQQLADRINGAEAFCDMELLPEADTYIISVKDDALVNVSQQLSSSKGRGCGVVLHTAGTLPMDLLKPHFDSYGVLYPMQTFSKAKAVDFSVIPMFTEGSDENALSCAKQLAGGISNSVYDLTSEQRKHLHLAAVWACNFVNHCYAIADDELKKVGLPFSVMLPLINETAAKIQQLSPREAQTGPAARWDTDVMERQKLLLKDNERLRTIYELMSIDIHD